MLIVTHTDIHNQQGIPEVPIRRGIGQIELDQFVHPHARCDGGARYVNTLGGVAVAGHLSAYELTALALRDKFHPKFARRWVISRTVPGFNASRNDRNTLGG